MKEVDVKMMLTAVPDVCAVACMSIRTSHLPTAKIRPSHMSRSPSARRQAKTRHQSRVSRAIVHCSNLRCRTTTDYTNQRGAETKKPQSRPHKTHASYLSSPAPLLTAQSTKT